MDPNDIVFGTVRSSFSTNEDLEYKYLKVY